MKIKDNIFIVMTAGLLLTGCQGDDGMTAVAAEAEQSAEGTAVTQHEICFRVGSSAQQRATRAVSFYDIDRLQTDCDFMGTTNNYFSVTAYMDGSTEKFINSSGNIHVLYLESPTQPWRFCMPYGNVLHYYWPETIPLNFFAFHPCEMSGGEPTANPDPSTCLSIGTYADRTPQLECTALPLTNIGQATLTELIYAYTEAITYKDYGGYAPLTFQHPLAAVSLTLSSAYPGLTLEEVTFERVYNNGTGTCSTSCVAWTTTGTVGNLQLTWNPYDTAEESPTYQKIMGTSMHIGTIDGPFLVLPQALTDRDGLADVTMTIKYKKVGETEKDITLPITGTVKTWESGKHYIYDLELGKDESVIIGCTVEDWIDHGNYTNIGVDEDE